MQDFAYLFPDSAASWLAGRGDARFTRYERYYRLARTAAPSAFDLEASNERYAAINQRGSHILVAILNSSAFKNLILFLVLLYGGSLLVPVMARIQPVATGLFLAAGFVALRVMDRRQRKAARR
jgi:hypothetical protein